MARRPDCAPSAAPVALAQGQDELTNFADEAAGHQTSREDGGVVSELALPVACGREWEKWSRERKKVMVEQWRMAS